MCEEMSKVNKPTTKSNSEESQPKTIKESNSDPTPKAKDPELNTRKQSVEVIYEKDNENNQSTKYLSKLIHIPFIYGLDYS